MITGITRRKRWPKEDNGAALPASIHDLFTVPQTCIVGYNNVRLMTK
ncbi:hypothetical protein LNO36_19645 [Klebsiella variicola subsp. variicola]|nr:hypothetical protein [Klebsiella variicola subsp. variicola]